MLYLKNIQFRIFIVAKARKRYFRAAEKYMIIAEMGIILLKLNCKVVEKGVRKLNGRLKVSLKKVFLIAKTFEKRLY